MRAGARRAAVAIALSAIVAGSFAGCAAFPPTFCEYGFCGGPVADAATDGKAVPPGCTDPTEPAKNAEKCFVDDFGVYVSAADGKDTNPGTRAAPFKTIGKALASGRERIVVCGTGPYTENLTINRSVDIYGGITCSFDKGGPATKLVAATPGYAVKILKSEVRLTDFEIQALPGAKGGEGGGGSFAMLVSESRNVNLVRTTLEAQAAAPAVDGELVLFPLEPPPASQDGMIPAGGTSGTCPGGGESSGGAGATSNGLPGAAGKPAPFGGAGGVLSAAPTPCAGGVGSPGADGEPGINGQGGAALGALAPSGWVGADGKAGSPGKVGGGGGGGAENAANGAGGGAGGCGGAGGGGGGAGGSSIALVIYSSEVNLNACTLIAGAPTAGGQGAGLQGGQKGGAPANAVPPACTGGAGGRGGRGGAGGGGSGGVSASVVYNTEPKFVGGVTTFRRATTPPAAGGAGGDLNDGAVGVNLDRIALP